jgi:hypothetical protein
MTVNLELPPDVQAGLSAQAQSTGLTLEAFAVEVLREKSRTASIPPLRRAQIAGARIRELRKGVALGGFSTKELIDEGRE